MTAEAQLCCTAALPPHLSTGSFPDPREDISSPQYNPPVCSISLGNQMKVRTVLSQHRIQDNESAREPRPELPSVEREGPI